MWWNQFGAPPEAPPSQLTRRNQPKKALSFGAPPLRHPSQLTRRDRPKKAPSTDAFGAPPPTRNRGGDIMRLDSILNEYIKTRKLSEEKSIYIFFKQKPCPN